ncbi:MAG: DUF1631 domain-containing protein [Gammaproteobacteria bacterium]|nr:MAG: DUF1631 domain-containing protein [Gammaproteobacteria bacterium]
MSDSLQKNVVNIEAYEQMRRRPIDGPGAQTLREVGRLTSDRLETLLERMMDRVDDALFERAEKAENNMLQTRYFDAMRELRIIRRDISEDFIALFTTWFNEGIPRSSASGGLALDWDSEGPGIGLVESDDLEEELAITNMVNKIRGNCKQSLFALDKRIGFLMRDPDLERWQNPLGPEAVCRAFRDAAKRIESGLEIRLVIFKLFDHYVASHLDATYKEVNQHLVKMGVLPEIRASLRRPATAPGTPSQSPEWANPAATTVPAPDYMSPPMAAGVTPCYRNTPQVPDADSVPMAEGIESYHQTRRQVPDAASVPMAAGIHSSQPSHSSIRASISALTFLQHGEAPGAEFGAVLLDPAELASGHLNVLHGIKQSELAQNLGSNGDMTIGIVAMLFDYILEDKNIPHAMRAMIGRLQIPVLKVALLDNEFFTRKSHPARLLLNRLASTAMSWNEQAGEQDPTYLQIESTVQTILDRFEDDISLFATLLEALEEFVHETERQAQLRAERSAKVMEGQERLEVAQSTTMDEIAPRISSDDNLDFVREFVATHWKNLLFVTCARQGKDSDAWKHAVTTMDELIWSVKPKHTPEQRQQLVAMQPRLLNSLRLGMERLSIPPTERDDFIAKLVRAHGRTVVKGDSAQQATTGEREAGQRNSVATVVELRKQTQVSGKTQADKETDSSVSDDRPGVTARQLAVGTWLEFLDSDGQPKRAKLSWVSPITGTLLFTDREGLKAGNYSVDEIAHLLRGARARVLNTAPLMDRAVTTVLKEYKNQ